jgi:hypothetical protein
MATRPVTLVFQEFATLSTTAATPALNTCVVGPAYWIQDFPADRTNIKLTSVYGVKNGAAPYTAPTAGTVAVSANAPNNMLGALVDPASVKVYFSAARVQLTSANTGAVVLGSPVLTAVGSDFVAAGVKAGDYLVITQSGVTTARRIRSLTTTTLTLTDEFTATGTTLSFRVERELNDVAIADSKVSVTSGTNTINIDGGVQLSVGGVMKTVTYAEVYVAYRSLRRDLQDIKTISDPASIIGKIGRIDARNPLAVGAFVALQNTNTALQYYGIGSDDSIGYSNMRSATGGRKDMYAVVPLTNDISVISAFKTEFDSMADVNYAITNGVPQKFRVVIGSAGKLPETKIVIDKQTDGTTAVTTGVSTVGNHTITFVSGVSNLISLGVKPGDSLSIDWDGSGGSGVAQVFTVAHVNSNTSLEIVEDGLATGTTAATVVSIETADGDALVTDVTADVTVAIDGDLVLDLRDANGSFLDSGVIPGDFVEVHPDLASNTFEGADRYVIADILSNQQLRIQNKGRNTALIANELPHGVSRSGTAAAVSSVTYRIVRALDKDGQVTELVARPASLNSGRAVICWPDLVDVAGLTLAGQTAPSQPGYYLACAVGGMIAALPSHQGFTNLGIAGIEKLYNSNTYFTDRQITQLSNGGWFVFQQDTPSALPYIVHQLTTSPATLQFGELSLVKNRDYVSMYLVDIVDDFIGPWNINKETIGFVYAAVQAGIDNLKLMNRPRIGAPIIDGRIVTLGESSVAEDRLELVVEGDFPKPLNTVALHLVSV